jgi:hypothetical protein
MSFVSAVPQVIFSSVNVTLGLTNSSITYRIFGEGIDATETLPYALTCIDNSTTVNFNYTRLAVPIAFSRDICENTDVGVLIHALADDGNLSFKYQDCLQKNADMWVNLTMCQSSQNTGCESNITQAQNNYQFCQSSLTTSDARVKDLESQRMLLAGAVIVAGVVAWNFWRKNTPKTLPSPAISQLPRGQKI